MIPPEPISADERRVLSGIAQGHTYQEIARVMDVSRSRVLKLGASAFRKLGADTGAQAVYLAMKAGVID